MESLAASALAQLDASVKGIHLFWLGAPSFLFAPGGWVIERRVAQRRHVKRTCDVLDGPGLARLRQLLEVHASQGVWSWREGRWPEDGVTKSEVVTFEFDRERRGIHGQVAASRSLVIGFLRGKAVAFATPQAAFDLGTNAIDRVMIHAVGPSTIQVCEWGDDAAQWEGAQSIAKLQLPLREFMPALHSAQDEFAEAKSRLLPGEALDETRFFEFADMLRAALRERTTAPMQRVLLMRDDALEPFEELSALDPIRMVYADPMWRRVLGLALFDRDLALVPGAAYDYRIIGRFPALEVSSRWYGFHTVPFGTTLPYQFSLHDCQLRLAQPTTIRRAPDVDESGALLTSRRGIELAPRGNQGWLGVDIEDASLVIDFGTPSSLIVLELARGHGLRYQAGDAWLPLSGIANVPPGPRAVLHFSAPVTQLRLFGHGFLFGFRFAEAAISGSDGMIALSTEVLGVAFAEAPRPAPPLAMEARNLQSATAATSNPPRRHQLGVALSWTPAPVAGLPFWPPDAGPPPLDATTFQIERRIEPAGDWTPVAGVRNRILGTRESIIDDPEMRTGVDVMVVYPEEAASDSTATGKRYDDVFLVGDGSGKQVVPPLGSMLGYRIRALDVVGRPSDSWTSAAPVRLEKHEPPPLPAAPSETPADALLKPAATGVTARAIVRGDPALSAADRALLGSAQNAVVLRWGWHARERALDPYATQFRVYVARPLDGIDGQLTSVADITGVPGAYSVTLQLQRSIPADAAKGLYLDAGTPFFIETHQAGTSVQATLRTRVPQSAGGGFRRPQPGQVRVPLRLTAALTRPGGWAERVEVQPGVRFVPITADTAYQVVIRDRLQLTDAHPRDSIWVGVSAADSESYVADTFPQPSPGGPMPGNESAVAFAQCQAVLMQRPRVTPVLALAPVPRIRAPEPVDAPIRFPLDLAPYLTGTGLGVGMLVQPERLAVSELLAALRTGAGRVFARVVARRRASEAEQEITLPNPDDHALLVAGLEAGDAARIDDRIVVYLAGAHPYADRLFVNATTAPIPFARFTETLHPGGARYLYRMRKASGANRMSARGAIAKVVVRVPSLMPSAPPRREPRASGDPIALLRLAVPRDSAARGVLVFEAVLSAQSDIAGAQLVRLAHRGDLPAADRVRLRMPGGALLTPRTVAFDAASSDAAQLRVAVTLASQPGRRLAAWACSVTEDDVVSALAGPWLVRVPPA